MNLEVVIRDSVEAVVEGPDPTVLRLGLLLPLSGPLGLIGPSALDAARLACSEINTAGGVMGRPIELVVSDVGGSPAEAAPFRQLAPALDWLTRHRRLGRWALVGSDYIWTWSVHRVAAPLVRSIGGQVVLERLVPFGLDPGRGSEELIDALVEARVDAVLLSLIGRDLVMFNRAFSRANLGSRIVRISGSLEENGLLAAGGDDSGELYASMRSFAGQQEARRIALAENHRKLFGEHAPVLDAYSEGCYDGVHLAAALASADGLNAAQAQRLSGHLLSPGDSGLSRKAWSAAPLGPPRNGTYIARADGLDLSVIATL